MDRQVPVRQRLPSGHEREDVCHGPHVLSSAHEHGQQWHDDDLLQVRACLVTVVILFTLFLSRNVCNNCFKNPFTNMREAVRLVRCFALKQRFKLVGSSS